MKTKICICCKQEKNISEYYKHSKMSDGYFSKCKECCKKHAKQNREKNHEYYLEYDRYRRNKTERNQKNKERIQKLKETDYKKYLTQKRKSINNWKTKYPEKKKAEEKVATALANGSLVKENCVFCGSNQKIEGHHEDYSKPLNVMWLCSNCHHELHSFIRNAERTIHQSS